MKKKILFVALLAAVGVGMAKLNKAKAVSFQKSYVHWLPTGCTQCGVGAITVVCNKDTYVPICN